MKEITYQIRLNNSVNQFVFTKLDRIPKENSEILIDKTFFNNNEDIFKSFIKSGGLQGFYKVIIYKEFKNGVQKNRVALI